MLAPITPPPTITTEACRAGGRGLARAGSMLFIAVSTLRNMSIVETRTVGSIIGGEVRSEGRRIESRNPANLDDVVCEAALGDADTFVDACRAARAAQRDWAAVPAPVRGNVVKQIGRLVEDNKEALSRLVTREIGRASCRERVCSTV